MKYLITGHNSILAKSIASCLAVHAHEVTLIGRTTVPKFDMATLDAEFQKILDSYDYLIHLAHTFNQDNEIDLNVSSSKTLVKILENSRLKKCVYISSDSASSISKSNYGRSKYNSEIEFLSSSKSIVLRLGVILDKNIPSPFNKIMKFTKRFKVLVAPSVHKKIYRTTNVEEITQSILTAIAKNSIGGPFTSSRNPNLKSMVQILNESGINPWFNLSVPPRLIIFFARFGKKIPSLKRLCDSAMSTVTPTEICDSLL